MGRRSVGVTAALLGVLLCSSACVSDVSNAVDAPINVIPDTDVAVETNIQSATQAAQTRLEAGGSFSGFTAGQGGGTDMTSGPSTAPGQVSYAIIGGGQGIVLAAWNHADQHCIGSVYIHTAMALTVLGVAAPGTYDFIAPAPSSSNCDAATFAATSPAPSGWPWAPSASGWKPI